MSGLQALRGFDYQITVTLDLLLSRFESDSDSKARPEGIDDLVLRSQGEVHYIQVKKPRETADGIGTRKEWSLTEIAADLVPGAIQRLGGNLHLQEFILGDEVDSAVSAVFQAGASAPTLAPTEYWTLCHLLARNGSEVASKAPTKEDKFAIERWRPTKELSSHDSVVGAYTSEGHKHGVPSTELERYREGLEQIHAVLPDILSRTRIRCTFGTELEIREKVKGVLAQRYGLSSEVVEHTLVRNLRGFIQDISVQSNRWIDKTEFEFELRNIWPRMNVVTNPPEAEGDDIDRTFLIDEIVQQTKRAPLEVVGASGSGKTKVAAALARRFEEASAQSRALYAPVRVEHSLRDVLRGVAFHLRRYGLVEPFAVVVDPSFADEEAISRWVSALAASPFPLLIILDLVEGDCSDSFAQELAVALKKNLKSVGFVVFGQRSAFRQLSLLERESLGIAQPMEMPGFSFEEFCEVATRSSNTSNDSQQLSEIFRKLTKGRSAGLLARLADTLGRASSLAEMDKLASMSPEAALAEADRARYYNIPEVLRSAVDRLTCFALPFEVSEAVTAFPNERIGEAVRELFSRGLLRQHGNGLFEMHETIRAGLESLSAPDFQRSSHELLATYYQARSAIVPSIYHLDRSGQDKQAHNIARDAFVKAQNRGGLADYVGRHRLLSKKDCLALIFNDGLMDGFYYLPSIVLHLSDASIARDILKRVRKDPKRFDSDYRWAWWVVELVLTSDPTQLFQLVVFAIAGERKGYEDRLDFLAQGVRRVAVEVSEPLIAHFNIQPVEVKWKLAKLLLRDVRRNVLGPVLSFVEKESIEEEESTRRLETPGWDHPIHLGSELEVIEFLAAIPMPEVSTMISRHSVCFGQLAPWIWNLRGSLRSHCANLTRSDLEPEVLLNAFRVLVFLGDASALTLAERFLERNDKVGAFACFLPALLPAHANVESYKERLLDISQDVVRRSSWLSVLMHLGVSGDLLFDSLMERDDQNRTLWEFMFVMNSVRNPCVSAIAPLERMLVEDKKKERSTFAPMVMKIGELPGSEAESFLLRMIQEQDANLRLCAALGLQLRRIPGAVDALVQAAVKESIPQVHSALLIAAIACHPSSVDSLRGAWREGSTSTKWRAILASRLGESNEEGNLVRIACDRAASWRTRRAAILAVERNERALTQIYPVVMAERSRFTIDTHSSLLGHHLLSSLTEDEAQAMHRRFGNGKAKFVSLFGDILEGWRSKMMWPEDSPTGRDAAAWLYDELKTEGWPQEFGAVYRVLDALHIPILQGAVLRGVRLCGRTDALEAVITSADSVWLLARAICESFKGERTSLEKHQRVADLARENPLSSHWCVKNIPSNSTPVEKKSVKPPQDVKGEAEHTAVNYEGVQRALRSGELPSGRVKIVDLDEHQESELAAALDPALDPRSREVPIPPRMILTRNGFVVDGTRVVGASQAIRDARKRLRPAFAAYRHDGATLDWHRKQLTLDGPNTPLHKRNRRDYLHALFQGITMNRDKDRLLAEFEKNGDVLLNYFDEIGWLEHTKHLVDDRWVPLLLRLANAGTDQVLASLCRVAGWLNTAAVDELLRTLFLRWHRSFDLQSPKVQHMHNRYLWMAFGSLTGHERFKLIPDYDLRLMDLLMCEMSWHDKRRIVRMLKDSQRAYVTLESRLLAAAPFEHYGYDEVDELDDAAQKLFEAPSDSAA